MTFPHFGRQTVVRVTGADLVYRAPMEEIGTLIARLDATVRRLHNFRPVFESFRAKWFEATRKVFMAQGLPVPWPALSPAYAEWKGRHYPGKTILRRTDALFASLTSMGPNTIWETTPMTIRYGSRLPYAELHQTGTERMPARPPIVMLPGTFAELNADVMRWATAELAKGNR